MAITAEELRILVRAETKAATDNLNRFRRTSQSTTIDLKSMAKQLIGPLSVTAGLVALGRVASKAISGSIKYAASVEQISVAFEVLLGSAQEAQVVLEELREFSVKTPFTFEELAPAAKRLIAFGTAAEDVVGVMRDLGNAAMGNGETLDRLVDAYGKVQAKGKASLEELNRFTEAGVPLMRQLAEDLELTNEELFKFVSQGKVGFNEVNTALQNLTRGEGQFAGMLEAQSMTLEGSLSTLEGAMQDLGNTMASRVLPFLREIVVGFTGVVNLMNRAGSGAGELTLAKEIENAAEKVRGLQDEYDDLDAKLKEREAFLGAEVAQTDPKVLDMLDELLDLKVDIANADVGLQSLIDVQSIEAEAARKAAEAARELQRINNELIKAGAIGDEFFPQTVVERIQEAIYALADVRRDTGDKFPQELQDRINELVAMKKALQAEQANEDGEEAADAFGKTFFSELVAMAGDPQFYHVLTEEAEKMGKESGGRFKTGFNVATVAGGPLIDFNAILFGPDKAKPDFTNIKQALDMADVFGVPGGPEVFFDPIVNSLEDLESRAKPIMDNLKTDAEKMWEAFAVPSGVAEGFDILNEKYAELKPKQLDLIKDLDNIRQSFMDMVASEALEMMSAIGRSMTDTSEGAKTAKEALEDFFIALLKILPQQMLAAGLARVIVAPEDPRGWLLIIGSGLLSLVNGAIDGARSQSGTSTDTIPSPSAARAATSSFSGDTVTVINGDVFTSSERNANTLAAVQRSGRNR